MKSVIIKWIFLFSLFITVLAGKNAVAHSNDISTAYLAIESNEQYQLTITVDVLHVIKRYQQITGDDDKAIAALKQLSFSEQKKLLDDLHNDLAQQTKIQFHQTVQENNETLTQEFDSYVNEQSIEPLIGLSLSHFKELLAQPNTTNSSASLKSSGKIPSGSSAVAIRFSPLFSDVQLTFAKPRRSLVTNNSYSKNFQLNNSSEVNSASSSAIAVATDYIVQGFIHIVPRGLDHILFVLALLLFAKRASTLFWQVSVFTLAHTITLALGIYGVITLSGAIVEPLIALSIAYVAIENIVRANSPTQSQTRLPIIFVFGLLHGLGFASVLRDVGLPEYQYALSLISFNIGVELGQLSVIALAFLALLPFMKKAWYQSKLVKTLNVAIAVMAIYWLFERLI